MRHCCLSVEAGTTAFILKCFPSSRLIKWRKGMGKGNIVFLIGGSSAGKTTLAHSLQDKFSEPYFYLSKDIFMCDMAPENRSRSAWPDKYLVCSSLFFRTIRLFSDMAKNVVADSVRLDDAFISLLSDCPVIAVHVTCHSVEELRRREIARGDRAIGQAERQLLEERSDAVCDMTVDTFDFTADECADKVCAYVMHRV